MEMDRIIVAFVQRDPGEGSPAATDPFAKERGLAEAGRRGDERELAVKPCIQPFKQARARHQLWWDRGNMEFGCQE